SLRDDPTSLRDDARPLRDDALRLLTHTADVQARTVAAWMHVGFVHGVMNTDNTTISGETIDYGPCAFLDAYDAGAVFSSIDHEGRYAYGNQPGIVLWNLTRLAETLLPLLAGAGAGVDAEADAADGEVAEAAEAENAGAGAGSGADTGADADADAGAGAEAAGTAGGADATEAAKTLAIGVLDTFASRYDAAWLDGMRAKLGLGGRPETGSAAGGASDGIVGDAADDDATDYDVTDERVRALAAAFLDELQQHRIDYTGAFRALGQAARGDEHALRAHYPAGQTPGEWFAQWRELVPDADAMDAVNPVIIPRNHLTDAALDAATAGDLAPFERLLDAVTRPFDERPGFEEYARPAPPGTRRHVTYCGT
ncbi:MAG: protein adenylyltransferase SelO family protein, partial [Leucobacter sp.]